MSSPTALPPIGTPLSEVQGPAIDLMQRLKRECFDVRDMYIGWADEGRNYYTYGASSPPDDGIVIANDIQNFIITQTDIQTKEPPSITLEAVDTQAPPLFYHNLTPQQAASLGLQPQEYLPTVGQDGQALPPQQLSYPSAQILAQAEAAGILPPDSLIVLTSSEVIDFFQKIFDVIWNRSSPDEWYWDSTLLNNVDGWCPALYEFDDDKKRHIFTNAPIRQFFCDVTSYDVERWRWQMPDIVYGADVAKALFPDFAEELEENATEVGKIERPPGTTRMGSQYEDVSTFQMPMVTLTILFLRDQDCMMSPEQAVTAGHLEKKSVGTGNWGYKPSADDPQGEMTEEKRDALHYAGTAEEAFPPGHPQHEAAQWPSYKCIRQLTMIASRGILIGDEECKYWDIPTALNINIPIIGKPFGLGEPFRLRAMQDARTRSLTAIADHVENFKSPGTFGPKSAREMLPEEFKDTFQWGAHLWVDDETIVKTQGKVMGVMTPPELPQSHLLADDKFKREMNDSGGNMGMVQGRDAEKMSQMSGVAIAQLQAGASSLSSFKARRMQAVIKRMGHLALHSILTRMTAADYGKIIKRYPPHVLEQLHAMAKDMEWTVKVTVAAGTGATVAAKKAESKEDYKLGLLSKETTQERIGEDPTLENQRQQEEAARITQQQPAPEAGQGQPAGATSRG